MVTTSNHVLVNVADFGDDLEIEGDVLAAKRSHEDDDSTSGNLPRDAAKIVRTTIHRVSVGVLKIKIVGIWCFVVCRS